MTELLSRYLDDDLGDEERTLFEKRLDDDPELRRELESSRELRLALSTIAGRMAPPPELDRVVEPLRQAPPAQPRRVRPVYRWLGAAAAVVLGVTVTLELARRNPSPALDEPRRSTAMNADDREIFELAPLPSAVPGEERPVGATERLLEEHPPPPSAPEPRALEVVGPLNEDEISRDTVSVETATGKRTALGEAGGAVDNPRKSELGDGAMAHESVDDAASSADKGRAKNAEADPGSARLRRQAPEAQAATGRIDPADPDEPRPMAGVSIVVGNNEVWTGTTGDCAPGRWEVRIEIRRGLVVGLEPVDADRADPPVLECRPREVFDAEITELDDGVYSAEIVVTAGR